MYTYRYLDKAMQDRNAEGRRYGNRERGGGDRGGKKTDYEKEQDNTRQGRPDTQTDACTDARTRAYTEA